MNDATVSCSGLCKTFTTSAEQLHVLENLKLEVAAGARVAITGSSGSGKSTLLSILGGLDRATAGAIRVGDWEIGTLSDARLVDFRAAAVGFVFQFHYLMKDFTALENVALPAYMKSGDRRASWNRARELLSSFGLGDRVDHFPSQLSGGERQRAAIARALINNPALILADEPTGNLDSSNAHSVRELLFELSPRFGTTLILATHDRDLATAADTRYELIGGALREV